MVVIEEYFQYERMGLRNGKGRQGRREETYTYATGWLHVSHGLRHDGQDVTSRQSSSEVVHGIGRGLQCLANGTRDKVICHLPLLQLPRKWGITRLASREPA